MSEDFGDLSALVQDEVAFLRDQLASTARLLKCSLKANRPFDQKTRSKVTQIVDHIEGVLEAREQRSENERQTVLRITEQASEMQKLVDRQDQLREKLQRQVKQLEHENQQLKVAASDQKTKLDNFQKSAEQLTESNTKALQERDLSKEQNKKLVELLQRMERKINDKTNREEELEEQNLQLKEMTKLMSVQVEKIERELENRLKKKDARIAELDEQLDFQKQESKLQASRQVVQMYNSDLDQELEDLEAMESQLQMSTRK